jgi:hypothetical protein
MVDAVEENMFSKSQKTVRVGGFTENNNFAVSSPLAKGIIFLPQSLSDYRHISACDSVTVNNRSLTRIYRPTEYRTQAMIDY